ncbi:MAG TPA: DUF1269 domain-containing protein [Gaiellaceae bacterium]|jgi:uncharacterized membrane protein|nr:DUF1269 domain-containing protein [Gaiellaceae bacterium]
MSDLVAVAYPDKQTAETVRSRLLELVSEHVIEIEDAVVVDREDDGKVRLHQLHHTAAAGAAGGALWGGLIGLLFLAPLLGAAVGAAAGGMAGAFTDVGISNPFMQELGRKLKPGGAALILLVRKVTPDKVLPEIASYGGEVIQTSLDDELEERLREALEARMVTTAA